MIDLRITTDRNHSMSVDIHPHSGAETTPKGSVHQYDSTRPESPSFAVLKWGSFECAQNGGYDSRSVNVYLDRGDIIHLQGLLSQMLGKLDAPKGGN